MENLYHLVDQKLDLLQIVSNYIESIMGNYTI